jgi:hypothetical protein
MEAFQASAPRELVAWVRRLLDPDPARRFETAAEARAQLFGALPEIDVGA